MCDNTRLASKIRIQTQLIEQYSQDQGEIMSALLKMLEDSSKSQAWRILSARRMILATLDTHHPNVDISKEMDRWKKDHKEENERQQGEIKRRIIPYYS